ncbi:hypothetical protein CAPTEDRAFT_190586 [Capitella teleta]|uniref:Uncharacterized protein n=1 Tax=Capitella teleta TaxID=283909 RepID=R7UB52_CAPTE|nr:hypothetical protein CAPTEDRAFT_190586 [Capitella teleta]|eukprot:ELU03351.1 hypothetical protein CAPTEDRAFT_190586 [Capitella teleta]
MGNEEELQEASKKKKSVLQAAFTRSLNSARNLVTEDSVPRNVISSALADIDAKFNNLEAHCQQMFYNDILTEAETSTIQLLLWKIIDSEEEPVVKNDPQYDQLLKMVHVTSTLPKPDARVFDGNLKGYFSFISLVETHIEENITNKKQCLAYLIDNCTEIAHESISYFTQCQDSEKAYDEAKKMLKEKSHRVTRSVITSSDDLVAVLKHILRFPLLNLSSMFKIVLCLVRVSVPLLMI